MCVSDGRERQSLDGQEVAVVYTNENTSAAFGNRSLLISQPTVFDQVDAKKGIMDAQYICLMTATVNSFWTLL